MSVSWGPYQNHVRLGIAVSQSPEVVGSSTTSVTLTLELWVQMDSSSSMNINTTVQFTGAWTGTASIPIALGPGQSGRIWRTTASYPTYTAPYELAFGATMSHYFGTTYRGVTWYIGARQSVPDRPAAPTKLTVTRSSDTRHSLSWTRNDTYTSVIVERRTGTGDWVKVAQPKGNVSSWVDTTTKANSRYAWRVRGVNAGGTSVASDAYTNVFTTPSAPKNVRATRIGDNIRIDATQTTPWTEWAYTRVRDGDTEIGVNVSLPYTHVNPALAVHEYRVRTMLEAGTTGNPALFSAWSDPVTVHVTAPPSAPSKLTPNGGFQSTDAAALPFTWQYNPTDSSEQVQYQIRWRAVGDAAWTERAAVSSVVESANLSDAAFATQAGAYEWQVRTRGAHPDWSVWSAIATVTMLDQPQVTILIPNEIVFETLALVEWEHFQAQGRAQSQARVELLRGSTVLETRDISGPASSVRLRTVLDGSVTYSVRVRTASGTVWSDPTTATFVTLFRPPEPPGVRAAWSESDGVHEVTLSQVDVAVATVSLDGDAVVAHF